MPKYLDGAGLSHFWESIKPKLGGVTKSGTGTVVSSDDAANLPPLSLTIHGKSVQDGTPSPSSPVEIRSVEGRNLLDDSNVYQLAVANTSIVANASYRAVWCELPPASSTRTMSFIRNTVEGNRFIICGTTSEPAAGVSVVALFTGNSALSGSFAVPAAYKYLFIYLSNAGGTISAGNIAVYEDYQTAPDYVLPCRNIAVQAAGANIARLAAGGGITESGGVFSGTANDFTGRYGSSSAGVTTIRGIALPSTLAVSFDAYTDGNSSTSGNGLIVFARNEGGNAKTFALIPNNTTSWRTFTGTLDGVTDATKICISYQSAGANIWHIRNLSARLDGSTEYVDYSRELAFVPLQGNSLRSLPDGTEDTLEVDGEGNVTLTKRVGAATINGSEGFAWILGTTQLGAKTVAFTTKASWAAKFDALANVAATAKDNVICDRLPANNDAYNLWDGPAIQVWVDDSAAFMICVGQSFSTSADFNTWLQSNPLTVYYPLATPQTISLGRIDLPSLPSPSFSMHVDAAVPPTLDAEWWTQGGGKVIDAVSTRIAALEADVTELQGQVPEREVLYDTSTWTIVKYGRTVVVHVHGATATPSTSTALVTGILADYKPAHNYSATISTSSGTSTQTARLCVYASDGGIYIVPAGYTSSASWYGTLTYIY